MRPLRLYIDTSVIGGKFDMEFKKETDLLFRWVAEGRYSLTLSEQVSNEIEDAPEFVRKFYDTLLLQAEICYLLPKAQELAKLYIQHNVVGEKSAMDAIHVALATLRNCDGVVSWNFKHIVHPVKSARFNLINARAGYKQLFILSPKELTDYDKR